MNNKIKRRLQLRFVLLSLAAILFLQAIVVGLSVYRNYNQMNLRADKLITLIETDPDSDDLGDVRYFTVGYDRDDGSFDVDLTHTTLVRRKNAIGYARRALDSRKESGYDGNFRFHAVRSPDYIEYTFLSRRTNVESFRSTTHSLVLTSLIGTAIMTALLAAVSDAVVKPLVRNRQKQQEFITAASHELKTPLTVIGADAQLLEEEVGASEWLTDIQKQVQHMTELTHRLVLLARSDEQGQNVGRIEFPISDVAEDVTDSFRALAQNGGKTLETNIEKNLTYNGDEKSIRELMSILLDNAFKYSSENGTICVTLSGELRGVRFAVENSVDHIDEAEAKKFTERFYRAENSSGVRGYGIGLSVAKAVSENHRGKLIVKVVDERHVRITADLR